MQEHTTNSIRRQRCSAPPQLIPHNADTRVGAPHCRISGVGIYLRRAVRVNWSVSAKSYEQRLHTYLILPRLTFELRGLKCCVRRAADPSLSGRATSDIRPSFALVDELRVSTDDKSPPHPNLELRDRECHVRRRNEVGESTSTRRSQGDSLPVGKANTRPRPAARSTISRHLGARALHLPAQNSPPRRPQNFAPALLFEIRNTKEISQVDVKDTYVHAHEPSKILGEFVSMTMASHVAGRPVPTSAGRRRNKRTGGVSIEKQRGRRAWRRRCVRENGR
ncbi:hypothetical protein SCHPADRAFT_760806 [Schizopora paradoxa]|uniref:Uncharacterized protein n=1 Tax=Schizopora paradoxa TaxID=27342 RepID=A0A0H2QXQ2_9AGAM|nr:hypothetical protein SCHPADRAFT_760806 [Schizopora paradoxa]